VNEQGDGAEHRRLVRSVGESLAELQAAYDDRDDALAHLLGVDRSGLRCLDLITRAGPQTSAQIARALHLTPGSVTALVDRMVRAGYASRAPHPTHGKKVLIIPTPRLVEAIQAPFAAHVADAEDDLADYSLAELALINTVLDTVRLRQSALTDRLRQAAAPAGSP
jgi:DNA-binding MarR family transcriptional regulator